MLLSLSEVIERINTGKKLLLAADKALLDKLPKGNWIGGTTPYFMSDKGGVKSSEFIFVTEIPEVYETCSVKSYSAEELNTIPKNYLSNGFSYILIPAFSLVHTKFAEECQLYENIDNQPLVGWIAGFDLNQLEIKSGFVYNGFTGEVFNNRALVLHVSLKNNYEAYSDMVNLFHSGHGDEIKFIEDGFEIKDCYINGELRNFADYLVSNKMDISLPLVTKNNDNYFNVSFRAINRSFMTVDMYAPVFKNTVYHMAESIDNYEEEFEKQTHSKNKIPFISFNCILNFVYANLKGKKTGKFIGPITFGEISNQLINQTMVNLYLKMK